MAGTDRRPTGGPSTRPTAPTTTVATGGRTESGRRRPGVRGRHRTVREPCLVISGVAVGEDSERTGPSSPFPLVSPSSRAPTPPFPDYYGEGDGRGTGRGPIPRSGQRGRGPKDFVSMTGGH